MKRFHPWLGLLSAALVLATPTSAQQNAIDVKVVSYKQLGETVTQLKGKVVVVDFWALTCVPCRKEFPHLVEMQKKYAKAGMAAISVSVDDPKDPETLPKVKQFLQQQGAAFTNLVLDEPPEVWQKKLETDGVPVVFVFNQKREIYKKYKDDVKYSDVEKDVRTLLDQK